MEAGRLVVDYDCEGDDGRITSGRILFEELLSFQYWDGSDRFRDFTIYFDDAGSLDVVAARCHVDR